MSERDKQGAIATGGLAAWVNPESPQADVVLETDTDALRADIREKLGVTDTKAAAALSGLAPALSWLQKLGRGEVTYQHPVAATKSEAAK